MRTLPVLMAIALLATTATPASAALHLSEAGSTLTITEDAGSASTLDLQRAAPQSFPGQSFPERYELVSQFSDIVVAPPCQLENAPPPPNSPDVALAYCPIGAVNAISISLADGADHLTTPMGSAGPLPALTATLGGGNDGATVNDVSGALSVDGGAGNDILDLKAAGPVTALGGPGDDNLSQSGTVGRVDGGPGKDTLLVDRPDGFRDTYDCGPGLDILLGRPAKGDAAASDCPPVGKVTFAAHGKVVLAGKRSQASLGVRARETVTFAGAKLVGKFPGTSYVSVARLGRVKLHGRRTLHFKVSSRGRRLLALHHRRFPLYAIGRVAGPGGDILHFAVHTHFTLKR